MNNLSNKQMKTMKLIFWISTAVFSLLMIMSAGMYFAMNEEAVKTFTSLGFPTYIIYPLAIAKILGVVAILTRKSELLKEWAYAGFFFDIVIALSAHLIAKDGEFAIAIVALVLVLTSYITGKKAFAK